MVEIATSYNKCLDLGFNNIRKKLSYYPTVYRYTYIGPKFGSMESCMFIITD